MAPGLTATADNRLEPPFPTQISPGLWCPDSGLLSDASGRQSGTFTAGNFSQ